MIQWNRKTGVLKCTFKTQVPVGCSHVSTQLSQLSKMPLASTYIVVSAQVDPSRSKSVVDNVDKTLWVYWPWVGWLLWKGPEHPPLVGGISSIAILKKGVSSLKHFAKKKHFSINVMDRLCVWEPQPIILWNSDKVNGDANDIDVIQEPVVSARGLCSTVSSLCASLQKTLITAVVTVILPAFFFIW